MPWYTTADARWDAEKHGYKIPEYTAHQVGELWYAVNALGVFVSEGYRTQAEAVSKCEALERERQQQRQVIYREGEGHD